MSIFNQVQKTKVDSNIFDLTHDVKLSTRFGKLTPVMQTETIPGDKFKISGSAMVRLAPTIAPLMHRCDVFMHYFFVPNRILWDNWEDFITGGEDGNNASVHPYINITSGVSQEGMLPNYLGVPTGADIGNGKQMKVNALPFCAFQKIWDDYYRDQNLQTRVKPKLTDGDNAAQIIMLIQDRKRAWAHDYFTSALPWTQRGPEAMLPLGATAPLILKDDSQVLQYMRDRVSPNAIHNTSGDENVQYNSTAQSFNLSTNTGDRTYVSVEDSHIVDLSTASASTIIELRRAFKLQEWLERNARGGARYTEFNYSHFGVKGSDKRLQRPEYIGGFKAPIKMSEVLQTSETTGVTPQGNMAGHGISVGGSTNYSYYCEEHGWIMGIMSVIPKAAYQQGLHRSLTRTDKLDYAFPSFAHIGEQPVYNEELYVNGTQWDKETFGYIPRYAEYKFLNNRVAGKFRSSLDFWHLGRLFSSSPLPALNEDFITVDPADTERIFAVQTGEDELWCQVVNQVSVNRKLPVFGTPKL